MKLKKLGVLLTVITSFAVGGCSSRVDSGDVVHMKLAHNMSEDHPIHKSLSEFERSMHYKNGFSARQVVDWAKESMHGSPLYQTDTEDFWSVFIEWADDNVPLLLRSELKKQGLNVK